MAPSFHFTDAQNQQDISWMKAALLLAKQASNQGEVPIGAVVINQADQTVLGRGFNAPISCCDPTAHAEMIAIRAAAKEKKITEF